MDDFNTGLTKADVERLAILAEEAGEVQQAIGKILRHGFESYNPDLVVNQMVGVNKWTNRQELEKELGDLSAAINLLRMSGDIDSDEVQRHSINKMKKINRFLHFFKVSIPQEH